MYVYLKIIVICHILISVFAKVGKVRVSFDCDCDAVCSNRQCNKTLRYIYCSSWFCDLRLLKAERTDSLSVPTLLNKWEWNTSASLSVSVEFSKFVIVLHHTVKHSLQITERQARLIARLRVATLMHRAYVNVNVEFKVTLHEKVR